MSAYKILKASIKLKIMLAQLSSTLSLLPQPPDCASNCHSSSSAVAKNCEKNISVKNCKVNRKVQQNREDYYFKVYAPPALTLPQSLQPHIPTAFLFTAYCNYHRKYKQP